MALINGLTMLSETVRTPRTFVDGEQMLQSSVASPNLVPVCLPDGTVALLAPAVNSNAAIAFIAGSSQAVSGTTLNTSSLFFTSQFLMLRTVCSSVWLRKLYPTPLLVIAMNAALNVLLVLIANFVVEPVIGRAIVKVKVFVMASLGAISKREVSSREAWLKRCLKPIVVGSTEVVFHIDSVLKIVNVERQRMRMARNSDTVMVSDERHEEEDDEPSPAVLDVREGVVADKSRESSPSPRGSNNKRRSYAGAASFAYRGTDQSDFETPGRCAASRRKILVGCMKTD